MILIICIDVDLCVVILWCCICFGIGGIFILRGGICVGVCFGLGFVFVGYRVGIIGILGCLDFVNCVKYLFYICILIIMFRVFFGFEVIWIK